MPSRRSAVEACRAPRHDLWDFVVHNCDPLKIIEEFGEAPLAEETACASCKQHHADDTTTAFARPWSPPETFACSPSSGFRFRPHAHG